VLFKDQVLEVRKVEGRLRIARKGAAAQRVDPPIPPRASGLVTQQVFGTRAFTYRGALCGSQP
jgi:hypothetical protein